MDFSINRQQLKGAMLRRIPHDGNLLPRSLIAWAGVSHRRASDAPAIIETPREAAAPGEPSFSLVADGWSKRLEPSSSSHRYRPAQYRASTRSQGPRSLKTALIESDKPSEPLSESRQRQVLLQPMDLYVLSHLLHLVKYSHTPEGVAVDSIDFKDDIELFIRPGALIDKMGYALSGDRYARVEESLQRLASFVVLHESRRAGAKDWQFEKAVPLLRLVDTGALRVTDAEIKKTGHTRVSEWRVVLGPFIRRCLSSAPSDLTVVPRSLWLSAGRSIASQFCALYVSQHGYDQAHQMYATRLDTLIQRSKLLDAESEKALFDTQQLKIDLERDQQGSSVLRDRLRQAERCYRRRQQQLISAFKRLGARLGVADIRYKRGNGDDVPPSKKGARPSASDQLSIVRLPATVESGLSQLEATQFKKIILTCTELTRGEMTFAQVIPSDASAHTLAANHVVSFCHRLLATPALASRWLRRCIHPELLGT